MDTYLAKMTNDKNDTSSNSECEPATSDTQEDFEHMLDSLTSAFRERTDAGPPVNKSLAETVNVGFRAYLSPNVTKELVQK